MCPEGAGTTGLKRCEQCGRTGTRGFQTIGGFRDVHWGWVREFTTCVATNACRRRWPKTEGTHDRG